MKENWLNRTELLIGKEKLTKLREARVTIVGLGGVGSFACESLARAGIGSLQIIDYDIVCETNINRQIIATHSTIGQKKTDVMKQRILDINPEAIVEVYSEFLRAENRLQLIQKSDFVIDAIDSIGPKMGLIQDLCTTDIPFISVLGAGNRCDPESIKITSIWQTSKCPFARRLKKLIRRCGITKDFPVVFSNEVPQVVIDDKDDIHTSHSTLHTPHLPKSIIGSISYMPAIMGMMAAGKAVQLICN